MVSDYPAFNEPAAHFTVALVIRSPDADKVSMALLLDMAPADMAL